jgi:ParB-like chromosome segregation protein Spo0J
VSVDDRLEAAQERLGFAEADIQRMADRILDLERVVRRLAEERHDVAREDGGFMRGHGPEFATCRDSVCSEMGQK